MEQHSGAGHFDEAKGFTQTQVSDTGPGLARPGNPQDARRQVDEAAQASHGQAVGGAEGLLEAQLAYNRKIDGVGIRNSLLLHAELGTRRGWQMRGRMLR